ncbi:SphA family protein [Sphingobium chungbukense]|nr:transporter [Sphingobium chungbukense]
MKKLRNISVTFGLLASATVPTAAFASEDGSVAYPLGVNTIMAGAMPEKGDTWFQDYLAYYNAGKFTDRNGNDAVPDFKADVVVNAMRVVHKWDAQIGPFEVMSGIVLPVVHQTIRTPLGRDRDLGLAYVEIQPIYLAYTSPDKKFMGYAGVDVYFPNNNKVSYNYHSFNPTAYMTWFPTPKLELSAAVGVELHSKLKSSDYTSGNLFYSDWGINYKVLDKVPGFSAGVGGYVVTQLTDDKLNGVRLPDGNRQRGFGIGPQIAYGTSRAAFGLKWQHEFGTENRPEGDKFWLQLMIPLKR